MLNSTGGVVHRLSPRWFKVRCAEKTFLPSKYSNQMKLYFLSNHFQIIKHFHFPKPPIRFQIRREKIEKTVFRSFYHILTWNLEFQKCILISHIRIGTQFVLASPCPYQTKFVHFALIFRGDHTYGDLVAFMIFEIFWILDDFFDEFKNDH